MKGLSKSLVGAVFLASFTCAGLAAGIFVATEVLAPEPHETSSVSNALSNEDGPSDALALKEG